LRHPAVAVSEVAATQGVPKEYYQVTALHARRKADFLRDAPGCDDAIAAMIQGAIAYAQEHHAKLSQIVCVGAQVSSEGVFSVRFLIVPFSVKSKPQPARRRIAATRALIG